MRHWPEDPWRGGFGPTAEEAERMGTGGRKDIGEWLRESVLSRARGKR